MSVFEWGDRIARLERHVKDHPDPVMTRYFPSRGWTYEDPWVSYAENLRGYWYRRVDERHAALAKEIAELRGLLACHKIKDRRSGAPSRRSPDRRAP